MTPDEARSLAVAIARRIGVIEDPLYVEERNFRTVVVFPHYVAWVAHDELGEGKLTLERKILRLLSSRLAVAVPTPLLEGGRVCLRTKLEGRPGLEHHRRVMADPSLVAAWADDLSALAIAVHTVLSVSEQAALVADGLPSVPALDLDDVMRAAEALPSRGPRSRSSRPTARRSWHPPIASSSTGTSAATTSSSMNGDGSSASSTSRRRAWGIGTTSCAGCPRMAKSFSPGSSRATGRGAAPSWTSAG